MNSVNNYFHRDQGENKENLIRNSNNSNNSLIQGNPKKLPKGTVMSQKSGASMGHHDKKKNECVVMRDTVTQTEFDDGKILAPLDHRVCLRCNSNDTVNPSVCRYSIQCPGNTGENASSFCIMYKDKISDYHVYPKCRNLGDMDSGIQVLRKKERRSELKSFNRNIQTLIGVSDILMMKQAPLDVYSDVDMVLLTPKSEAGF
jgi:hypothetical protein